MKKTLILTVLALAMLFILFGCTDTPSDSVETTAPVEQDADPLILVHSGTTDYTVIRPEHCLDNIIESMTGFRNAVQRLYGVSMKPSEDFVPGYKSEEPYASDAAEILIGNTNRKESQEVLATLEKGEYRVCVVGNKLVMIGYTDYLTTVAVNKFVGKKLTSKDGDTLSVSLDFVISGKQETPSIDNNDATLRIMTFNIIAADASVLTPRIPYIIDTIETYEPGVACFQECNATHHTQMISKLKGYKVATQKHAGSSTYVYTPIVYKEDLYKLLASGSEWNESRYTATNTKSIAWAVFEDIESKEVFSVINIHGSLWADGYTLPSGKTNSDMKTEALAWREDNVRQMNDRMKAIKETYGDIPVIWTGDFNFNSDSTAYSKVINEYDMFDSEITATISRMPGRTTHTIGELPSSGKSIDHIFGNSKVIFRIHYLCKNNNELRASDHCAVLADLKFTK